MIIYIFYRRGNRDSYKFDGIEDEKYHKSSVPVEITWSFSGSAVQRPEVLPEEVENPESYVEGATKTISVNIYERNPQARKACLAAYGHQCSVCSFDFEAAYGEVGR